MTDRILRKPETIRIAGLSDTTIWRKVKAGTFPAPVKLTERLVGWRESDIKAWLDARQSTVEGRAA